MLIPGLKNHRDPQGSAEPQMDGRGLSRRTFAGAFGLLLGSQPLRTAAAQNLAAAEDKSTSHAAEHESSQAAHSTPTYQRLKTYLDSIPAIDTHAHLHPFDDLPFMAETDRGRGANLWGLWSSSYFGWTGLLTPWKPGMAFDDWWKDAKESFANTRSLGFYRHMRLAIRDLYGLDFNVITDAQARDLDHRIFANYQDQKWLHDVITKKANIELELEDPFWARFGMHSDYDFSAIVFNVTPLVCGPHPQTLEKEFTKPLDDPGAFSRQWDLEVNTLDEYLSLVDLMFKEAKQKGAVCLKTTIAYNRTLQFDVVPKERAAKAFAGDRSQLPLEEAKALEDYLMWRLPEFSAKYKLPFQIHTGLARLEGSNPLLLMPLLRANPETKFILFHGGFPWVGETGAVAFERRNVWIDCNWLPMVSFSTAKRAFHEWLDLIPTNRIMWGSDSLSPEEIYGASKLMRNCWAEVLAERVERGELDEPQAMRIGRQILRENALEMFPQLKDRLAKQKG